MKIATTLILIPILLFYGCRKKDDPVATTTVITNPLVKIVFDNYVNSQPLVLNTVKYTNANGDTFSVSKYKYYISNISLLKDDGTEFAEPESYHLIDQAADTSKQFLINNIPIGNYTKIRFMIGVDSARNVSGAQTGALDPLNAMFWTWNTGYIMAQMEGTTPQASKRMNNMAFHIAGFSGPNSVLKWVTLSLPSNLIAAKGKTPGIHIKCDIAEWFKNPVTINFSTQYFVVIEGSGAKMMADNYADMFSVDHIE